MDATQLKLQFPEGIPAKLQAHVDKFQNLVDNRGAIRVKLLSNFGLCIEESYTKGYDVFKGFVIELKSDYKLSASDKFWLHPELLKTRNLYKSSSKDVKEKVAKQKFDISSCGSSVALYTTHSFDEIGGYKEEDYVIIDTAKEDIAMSALDHWINSSATMRQVYSDLHTLKFDGKTLKEHTTDHIKSMATNIGDLELVSSSNYNTFLRSENSFLFYNHAFNCSAQKKALVHISPLMGYCMIKGRGKEFESDLLSCSEYLDISKFNDEQRRRAYINCRWEGKGIVNTYTLRKPISNYKSWLGEEKVTSFRMETGYFSNTPIVDKLDPAIVLFLTPEATQIPEEKEVYSHIKKNIVKLPATEELLVKLVKNHWKDVFSKKFVASGDNLALPRHLLKELI